MEEQFVIIEKRGAIALLTVNRPKALNALNAAVLQAVAEAFKTVQMDQEVQVVIVTGSGEKAFVAGADIKEMAPMNAKMAMDFSRLGLELIEQVDRMTKPVIAAVNGFCLGGGFELALACDFIYASENAVFGFPEVTLGVIPGLGGSQTLPRLVGPGIAKELLFSGAKIDAQEALRLGIANKVIPLPELLPTVEALAQKIARNGGVAVGLAKDAVNNGLSMTKHDGVKYESTLFGIAFSTEDQKEGMQAFIEKRKAEFKNR